MIRSGSCDPVVIVDQGRLSTLARVSRLVGDLLEGTEHDRHTIADALGVKLAAADRHIKALSAAVPLIRSEKRGKRRVYKIDLEELAPKPEFSTVVAACFGASLAHMFEGTTYEHQLREAFAFMKRRARRQAQFQHIDRKFFFVRRGGEVALPDKSGELDDVIDAVLNQLFTDIVYCHFDGKTSRKRISPLSLVVYQQQLYLLGRDSEGKDYPYRFSRLLDIGVSKKRFEYPGRVEFDPQTLFADSFGVFISDSHKVEDIRVRLDKRWIIHAKSHRWHPTQKIVVEPNGVVVTLRGRVCPELEAWILGFGEDVEVLGPPALRRRIARRTMKAAATYA